MDLGATEIPALLAVLAGTGLSVAGAAETANQQNQDVSNVIAQENAFSNQAKPIYSQNLNQSTPAAVTGQLNTDQAKALANYAQVQQQPMTTAAPAAPSTPGSVTANLREKAAVGQQNEAASQLAAYGQQATDQSVRNQQTGNQLGVINQEAANAAALLPIELQTADSGAPLQAGGSLLSSLGGLYGTYSAISPLTKALNKIPSTAAVTGAGSAENGFMGAPMGTGYPGGLLQPDSP